MCGILALIKATPSASPTELLSDATRLIRHRGPDDEGFLLWRNGQDAQVYAGRETAPASRARHRLFDLPRISDWQLAFGHRRLSILDLSPAGHQPMNHSATGLTIIYNGEIYNHVELRRELEACGHSFQSESDTEVILAAWAEWGVHSLERLNGMFAFVLFDPRDRTVHAARDRFGI